MAVVGLEVPESAFHCDCLWFLLVVGVVVKVISYVLFGGHFWQVRADMSVAVELLGAFLW